MRETKNMNDGGTHTRVLSPADLAYAKEKKIQRESDSLRLRSGQVRLAVAW